MALPHISVCTCTFKRPAILRKLLASLAHQNTNGCFEYSVTIADNDSARSAEAEVSSFSSSYPVSLHYCVEPEQNIALARNRALAESRGELIAFIDDDEWPNFDWLHQMFKTLEAFSADGVLGPVLPVYQEPPPAWVLKGRFFERLRHSTGFPVPPHEGRTGNLLFRRSIITGTSEPFRKQFGGGGEDRDFFARMICTGKQFVWCDEAPVYEFVPMLRWSRRFMLKRAFLRGKMASRRDRGVSDFAQSLAAVATYGVSLPVWALFGHHQMMKYLIKCCDHAGKALALINLNPLSDKYVTQ